MTDRSGERLPWEEVVPEGFIDGASVAFPTPRKDHLGHLNSEVVYVRSYLEQFLAERALRNTTKWEHSSEVLIERLSRLMLYRDDLLAQLAAAYNDLEIAQHEVNQLEALVDFLQSERFGKKHKRNKKQIGQLALVAATFLSGVVGAATDHVLVAVEEARESAAQVRHDCSVDIDVDVDVDGHDDTNNDWHDTTINVDVPPHRPATG